MATSKSGLTGSFANAFSHPHVQLRNVERKPRRDRGWNPAIALRYLVRGCCLCLHVQRAARALAGHFDAALRPLDLTNGQFSLLMSLNRPAPSAMAGVASLLAMDRTTLTAALKPLERRGLVRVAADRGDRRNRLMALTPKGMTLLAKAVPIWERTHHEIEGLLPDGDPTRLRSNLRSLSGARKSPS